MDKLFTADALLSLLTLSLMEIVLGIDNIVFISILVGKLPAEQQDKARKLGLTGALLIRLGLLGAVKWIMGLTTVLFSIGTYPFSGQKLILLGGGLFLVGKSTHEIYEKLEGEEAHGESAAGTARFGSTLVQILLLDIVFSLDSVITAVGMAQQYYVMAAAMVIAVGVMLVFAKAVGDFVNRHPSMKILALSFLLLIGVMLIAEGCGQHVEKGYIYFAMAFSLLVEVLNMRFRKKHKPVHLRGATERRLKPD
ncbi:MAG TPA: TerC family protein [Planctomycetota bacterium]|nr:TerC family protein [Planctomycetota bacterium]